MGSRGRTLRKGDMRHRTLQEDARGFTREAGKRRNLLNSAGSDDRPGTLGHRTSCRALSDTTVSLADGTAYTIPRRKASSVRREPDASTVAWRKAERVYRTPRRPLHAYLAFLDRFPNVVACYRLRPDYCAIVDVSMGAGRGW